MAFAAKMYNIFLYRFYLPLHKNCLSLVKNHLDNISLPTLTFNLCLPVLSNLPCELNFFSLSLIKFFNERERERQIERSIQVHIFLFYQFISFWQLYTFTCTPEARVVIFFSFDRPPNQGSCGARNKNK